MYKIFTKIFIPSSKSLIIVKNSEQTITWKLTKYFPSYLLNTEYDKLFENNKTTHRNLWGVAKINKCTVLSA